MGTAQVAQLLSADVSTSEMLAVMGNSADLKAGHISALSQSLNEKSEQITRLLAHHEEGAGVLSVLQSSIAEHRKLLADLTATNQKSTEQITTLVATSAENSRQLSGLSLVGLCVTGQCNRAGDAQ